jgi:hypothetical protein
LISLHLEKTQAAGERWMRGWLVRDNSQRQGEVIFFDLGLQSIDSVRVAAAAVRRNRIKSWIERTCEQNIAK